MKKSFIITNRLEFNNIFIIDAETKEEAIDLAKHFDSSYWQKCVCDEITSCEEIELADVPAYKDNIKEQGYF
jgi:hypothetical protein